MYNKNFDVGRWQWNEEVVSMLRVEPLSVGGVATEHIVCTLDILLDSSKKEVRHVTFTASLKLR